MTGRALLTPAEREVLAELRGNDEYRSSVRTRLRGRIEELAMDMEILDGHEPELRDELRKIVCSSE